MAQNKITEYQLAPEKRFNYKRVIFLVLAALFISVFLYSVKAHALEFNAYLPDTISLYRDQVDVSFSIKNESTNVNLYEFKLYTSPFSSRVSPGAVRLNPGEEQLVQISILPLENTTDQEYTSTLEITENQIIHFYSFKIVQATNKVCPIQVNYNIDYLKDSDRYHLNLSLTNTGTTFNTITLNKFEDLNADQFKEMSLGLSQNESKQVNYYIDTNKSSLTISYVCNNLFETKKIDFPEKPKPAEARKGVGLSGYFSYANFKNIVNSLTFQIILLVIIILLVLSFTTRYIKLIHINNYRRR